MKTKETFTPITDSYDLVRDRLHSLRKELLCLSSTNYYDVVDVKGQCAGLEFALAILKDQSIKAEKIAAAEVAVEPEDCENCGWSKASFCVCHRSRVWGLDE